MRCRRAAAVVPVAVSFCLLALLLDTLASRNPARGKATAPQAQTALLTLEHDLTSGASDFTEAGELVVKYFPASASAIDGSSSAFRVPIKSITLTRKPLTSDEKSQFLALIESNGFYRLRVPVNLISPESTGNLMASIKARCLAQAGLRERLTFNMDDHGNAISLQYSSADGVCDANAVVEPPSWQFDSTCMVKTPVQAPKLNSHIVQRQPAGLQAGSQAGLEGAQQVGPDGKPLPPAPEPSFFRKYWMVLVPGVLLVLNILSQANPEVAQAAGGAGGAGGGGPRRRAN
eukprot:jgi/Chlat1/223/Chrsp1S03138